MTIVRKIEIAVGKIWWAIFGTHTFGSKTPPPPLSSDASLGTRSICEGGGTASMRLSSAEFTGSSDEMAIAAQPLNESEDDTHDGGKRVTSLGPEGPDQGTWDVQGRVPPLVPCQSVPRGF